MKLENPWVGYNERGYRELKSSLINRLKTLLPEMTDYSPSNIFIILIDYLASLAELLNYYIDNAARELYVYSAQHMSSMIQLSRLIDYRIKAKVPATTTLVLVFQDNQGNETPLKSDLVIKAENIYLGTTGVPFRQLKDVLVKAGSSRASIDVEQTVRSSTSPDDYVIIGTVPSGKNPVVPIPSNYADGSGTIYIDGEQWDLRETLGFSSPTDRVFVVEYISSGVFVAKFGDDTRGLMPRVGAEVKMSYLVTLGKSGNVDAHAITSYKDKLMVSPEGGLDNMTVKVDNPSASTNGSDRESIDDLREHIGCSLRTLDRAVTFKDFIDLAKLCPGVDKVGADFSCETGISYYITPDNGGEAQEPLLASLESFINARKVLGVPVKAYPAGESKIALFITVWGKYGKKKGDIDLVVSNALINEYKYSNSDINRAIYTSDIIALVDNQEPVDHLTLDGLYYIPYARKALITDERENQIIFPGYITLKKVGEGIDDMYMDTEDANWAIIISVVREDNIDLILTKEGTPVKNFDNTPKTPGSDGYTTLEYNNILIKMNLETPGLQDGDSWEFKTYKNNIDIPVDDNSVPVLNIDDIHLTVIEYANETLQR